jgi:hypothetical protein
MKKDYESWHLSKEKLNDKDRNEEIFYEGEFWMCSLGVNIGSEQDGIGDKFSRPVFIFKIFNADGFWGIPITQQPHKDEYHFKFNIGGSDQYAILSQIRFLSAKRLRRMIAVASPLLFLELCRSFSSIVPKKEIPN